EPKCALSDRASARIAAPDDDSDGRRLGDDPLRPVALRSCSDRLSGEKPTPDEQQILKSVITTTLERRTKSTATDSLVHDGQVLASGASFSELMALPPQHLRYEQKNIPHHITAWLES